MLTLFYQKPETSAENVSKTPETAGSDETKNGKDNDDAKQNGNESGVQTGDGSGANNVETKANEASGFSPEQDAKLVEMKADGKSTWRQIAAELKKPQSDIKQRFKELKANDGGGGGGVANGDQSQSGGDANGSKGDGGGGDVKDKNQGKKEQDAKGQKDNTANGGGVQGEEDIEPAFTLPQWKELAGDDMFDVEELDMLAKLVRKDKDRQWLRIASGFYDRTGRRVHERDIEERFEGLRMK
ncbi:MAG: hypothetical protein M1821_005516 [Bathelium mastoideum]|nr:MAG: hypothetical protein M1821_005516 [Bathelium mastoideum]KAI9691845.1 MAG: hypothetical protein M1822_007917 [Bathelium mastoideum]